MIKASSNMKWIAVVVAAALYFAGFVVFVLGLPKTPARAVHADGIVALTGGGARLDAAEALLEEGAGKRLLISGVYPAITKNDLRRLVHGGHRFNCCADLGFSATSTHGNAAEAATWAHAHGYRSLVVVTANYHMPRSLNEFAAQMPGMRLLAYPVAQDGVDVGEWWSDPHTLRILHVEYAKYLGSLVLTALTVPHEPRRNRWRQSREAQNGY